MSTFFPLAVWKPVKLVPASFWFPLRVTHCKSWSIWSMVVLVLFNASLEMSTFFPLAVWKPVKLAPASFWFPLRVTDWRSWSIWSMVVLALFNASSEISTFFPLAVWKPVNPAAPSLLLRSSVPFTTWSTRHMVAWASSAEASVLFIWTSIVNSLLNLCIVSFASLRASSDTWTDFPLAVWKPEKPVEQKPSRSLFSCFSTLK